MRAVVQRVNQAQVRVENKVVAKIGLGLVVLLGISPTDTEADVREMAEKVANLRIFGDAQGKMNLSCLDINGEIIVVSQFTLYADTRRGRRPSFTGAASPELAEPLCQFFVETLRIMGVPTQSGVFGAHMVVDIQNDGPVTILLEQPADPRSSWNF
ncbi:MAG TPA: D-aminoacyl-tRNA deacylase [Anaerolineaceae bacterium]|jgi:D-tyrosyl-tRNA(Tyr) deacylase|nr:D-aminoacyl-tRNA deacylase [Anaerolineaceae bacterium]HUM49731.1 D-aminoacyl-tRNA deacylase [Anaerolineaceae bacterium]